MKGMKDMKIVKKTTNLFFMFFMSFASFMSFFWALHAQTQSTEAATVLVRIETPFGNIDLAIDVKHAPVTAANFLKYVDAGLYNGGRFNRVTRPDNYTPAPPNRPMMELIQGGMSPDRAAEKFPAIPLERTSVTGLKHVVGTVSMARGGPDSATSEFFILLNDQPSLDFGGMRFDDGQGAAAFGKVIAGLDVVRTIQAQPLQSKDQNPQSLNPPVPIVKVYRLGK
ncbi:MAG: peptidylprolyl isomerase [Acidobacteriota bacterium]